MNLSRIVCAFDAEDFANEVERLLRAQGVMVEVCVGPFFERLIETAKANCDAVVLIWSRDGAAQGYMRRWHAEIGAERLVELSVVRPWPQLAGRRYQPIDFTNWNGVRGGAAWRALEDRLRLASRSLAPPMPPTPPKIAGWSLAAASVSAVIVAGAVRVSHGGTAAPTTYTPIEHESITASVEETSMPVVETTALGGPLDAVEPFSSDVLEYKPLAPRIRRLDTQQVSLAPTPQLDAPMHFNDPGLLGRLTTFAEDRLRDLGPRHSEGGTASDDSGN